MRWRYLVGWIILILILSGFGLAFAFASLETALVGFLIYLPLTSLITWLMVYRGNGWMKLGFFGLWLLVFLGWLTYIGPYIAALFEELPPNFAPN